MRRLLLGVLCIAAVVTISWPQSGPNVSAPSIQRGLPGHLGGAPSSVTVGNLLSTDNGRWSGSPTGYSYLWEDCDSSGLNCSTATGATTNTSVYSIVAGDVGSTLRVQVTASFSGKPDASIMSPPTGVVSGNGEFPLSVSSNGRYLKDATGAPFLVVGDSPQSLTGDNSVATAESFIYDRASQGFNAIWVNLLCGSYTFCPTDGKGYNNSNSTADNLAPFTSGTGQSSYTFGTSCANCNS